ncbi:SH3 domain-containing protein, partial [Intestinibacter bartlettii]|uniref:SH3 domain-containing protein n=1 Tax=Intestinibacter bartlettii TaxID=261299 RepID=UPI0011069F91
MSKSFQMFKKRCGKVIITAGLIVATTVSVYADNTALANANVETGTKTKVEKVLAQDSKITIKVGKVKVGNSRLNVRNKASLSGKIIGKLYTGNKVEIVGENSNWYEINYKGGTAYISKKYVKTSSTTVTEVEDCSDVFKAQISFNVRTGPSTSYAKIGKLAAGQVFQVTGKCSNGWYQIKFGSKVGYISSKYLDEMEQGSTDPEVIGTAKVNTKSTKDQYLAIRAGQGTHTALLDNSKTGDVLEILADKSPVKGWTKVRYNNLNGYAYTKWLEIGETPVKDEAPVVTSKDSITLNVGDKFEIKDLDLKVIDKEDGDITDKAVIDASDVDTSKPGQYWVKLSVIDSHGNTVTKLIGVKVVKKAPVVKDEAPVITSKDSITLNVGDKFEIKDLDLKVIDKEDGDITDKAVIDASDVDTSKPGQYWVKLSVIDSHGNTVTKLIGVKVVKK